MGTSKMSGKPDKMLLREGRGEGGTCNGLVSHLGRVAISCWSFNATETGIISGSLGAIKLVRRNLFFFLLPNLSLEVALI